LTRMKLKGLPDDAFNRRTSALIVAMAVMGLLLLVYTITRAIRIELTIDEIHSWEKFANKFRIYPEEYGLWTANHHWLNSWSMQFCGWIFGESSLSLRLPNLIAHAAYLYFTARLALLVRRDLFAVPVFILLNAHPYLLDFFSLARGYGLALGTLAGSVYFLLAYAREQRTKQLLLCIFFVSLSVISNFVMLNFFFVLAGVLALLIITGTKQVKKIHFAILVLCCGAVLLPVIPHVLHLRAANSLAFGNSSFWNETISGLCWGILYDAPYAGGNPFCSARPSIIVLTILIIVFNAILFYRGKPLAWVRSNSGLSFMLFSGTILFMLAQNVLFKTPFPPGRASLFLLVLFLLALLFSISEFFKNVKIPKIIFTFLFLPVLLHFIARFNLESVYEWRQASGTRAALERITAVHDANPGKSISVVTGNISGASFIYLVNKQQADWLKVTFHGSGEQPPKTDYYFVEVLLGDEYDISGWTLLDSNSFTGNRLFVDKNFSALE
jgi:hypothetical protein